MQVMLGQSERWGRNDGAPHHLVVLVAERHVLACTGGAVTNTRNLEFDVVAERLTCGPCRRFWRRARDAPKTQTGVTSEATTPDTT